MATPLVRTPQIQGGTMYAFASGTRDLTRAFQNPDIKFEFSKYALLDIPNFEESVNGKNTVDFDQMLDYSNVAYSPVGNAGHDFAITFQNYALNLEEELLQDDDFDSTLYGSDAEQIFFKWLHKMGAIRFKTADSTEATLSGLTTEELNATGTGTDYDRVVKYLGSIDVGNDIQYKGNAYHEVYINVPSSIGYTPTVLFNSKTYNTTANKVYPEATISGRNGQTHPDVNMDLETLVDIVDTSDPQNLIPYYDIDINSTPNFGIDWTAGDYHGIATNSDLNTFSAISIESSATVFFSSVIAFNFSLLICSFAEVKILSDSEFACSFASSIILPLISLASFNNASLSILASAKILSLSAFRFSNSDLAFSAESSAPLMPFSLSSTAVKIGPHANFFSKRINATNSNDCQKNNPTEKSFINFSILFCFYIIFKT